MAFAAWEPVVSALPTALAAMIPFRPGRRIRAHLIRSRYEVLERGVFADAGGGSRWFIAARPDSYSRIRPGSAVCGVLVWNRGPVPVGISRITMVLDPPVDQEGSRAAGSGSPPVRQVPRWISGADLPCTVGARSIGCWCVPTSEVAVHGGHGVGFEVVLDGGRVLKTDRVDVWRSR